VMGAAPQARVDTAVGDVGRVEVTFKREHWKTHLEGYVEVYILWSRSSLWRSLLR